MKNTLDDFQKFSGLIKLAIWIQLIQKNSKISSYLNLLVVLDYTSVQTYFKVQLLPVNIVHIRFNIKVFENLLDFSSYTSKF